MTDKERYEQLAQAQGISVAQVEQLTASKYVTTADLERLSPGAVRKTVERLEIPDRPRAREAYLRLQLQDDLGQIPPSALPNALRQLDSIRTRAAVKPLVAGVPTGAQVRPRALAPPMLEPTAGLTTGQVGWVSLGPGNIGGRTRSIVIHPEQTDVMWAGSVGGGIWRTDNGGGSWAPVDDFMANLAVCSMVMDPTDADVIYAGTGEGFSNLDAMRGAGIFLTVDSTNWVQLASTTDARFEYVNRLAMSHTGTILVAATLVGLFRSSDQDRLNWTQVLTGERMADVKFHPADSRRAVAGGQDNGKAYYSNDYGQTWRVASHPGVWSGRVELAYAVADASIVYASVEMIHGEIWRSTDGGRTYSKMQARTVDEAGNLVSADYLRDQGWYDNVIWAGDPTDANVVVIGGIDLWRSTDGGDTLVRISNWWQEGSVHADHHAIVSHPDFDGKTNKTVFFGNDGGIHKTNDIYTAGTGAQPGVSGWAELVNTYAVTQFYGGAGNPNTGAVIGGAQDNGTLAFTPAGGSEQWATIFGGDGGYCAADPVDPNYFYGEYVYLMLFRSSQGPVANAQWWNQYICGRFWNDNKLPFADWDWKPVPYSIPDAQYQRALFIAPFIMDPNNPERLLAGGQSLWRTNDAKAPNTDHSGPAWARIKTSVGAKISAIAVAQGDADIIWVGHENGAVYRTENGTDDEPLWQRVDQTGSQPLAPSRFCTQITIDPRNHQIVYVTYGGYRPDNVWRTSDGGQTWASLGGGLPQTPARSLVLHPDNSSYVYLGTEVGLFASEDGGSTWSPTNEGPTNCSVSGLFWMDRTLVCATHGRGMFQIDLSLGSQS